MAKSIDYVLQSDGTYKWEEVELVHSTGSVEAKTSSASTPKVTKKKVTKKKTTSPLSD